MDRIKHRPMPLQKHIPVIVGASGEKVGLRIAATYADYWQMSVGPSDFDEFRHKKEVLDRWCRDVGRDRAVIKNVPEGAFILRETRAEADAAFKAYSSHFSWTDEIRTIMESTLFAGPSDEVAARLRPLREAGIDGLIYQALPPYDFETIRRLATEVAPALAG
jgi:alkanesulfonate monooxygenase SsuD/methylene tetrahydromethanopterin reductase-like flavin-dependent oxidoreductase (luciferase family)